MTKPITEGKKIFVNKAGYATIVCPHCGVVKNNHLEKFRCKNNKVQVRCTCGESFIIHLDFRQYYRKKTDLPAFFTQLKPSCSESQGPQRLVRIQEQGDSVNCRIVNLSKSGFRLKLLPGLKRVNQILPLDAILKISFVLDDKAATKIAYEAKVISEEALFRGCLFLDSTAYEKAFGFYLFP